MATKNNFLRARGAVAITPADSDLAKVIDAFRVGTTAGPVSVVDEFDQTVIIPGVQVGETIALRCKRINSTGTTAAGITGYYE